jgi:HprK-related kinase A
MPMSVSGNNFQRVGDLSAEQFRERLRGNGLVVRIGPFDIRLRAQVARMEAALHHLYRDYAVLEGQHDVSFHVQLSERWKFTPTPKRMVHFSVDGRSPHPDMPAAHALAVLEWGLNLVIALRYHCFLMLHAAVVEKHGRALILPGTPGSGKSTLCAALVHSGWRLLSDEFGVLRPGSIELLPLPRLVPIKNESIDVLTQFAPHAQWGPIIPGTRKGTVRHMRPPREHIDRSAESARAGWIVFPKWRKDATISLQQLPAMEGFAQVAANSFNYEMLGEAGFSAVEKLISSSTCHTLDYSHLDTAIGALDELAARDAS